MRLLKLHPLSDICSVTIGTASGRDINQVWILDCIMSIFVCLLFVYRPQLVNTLNIFVFQELLKVFYITAKEKLVAVALFLELQYLRCCT